MQSSDVLSDDEESKLYKAELQTVTVETNGHVHSASDNEQDSTEVTSPIQDTSQENVVIIEKVQVENVQHSETEETVETNCDDSNSKTETNQETEQDGGT